MSTFLSALQALLRTLFKLLLLAAGAAFGLVLLAFGVLLTTGLVAWALLRGRKPVQIRSFRWRGVARSSASPAADVVDIEAREVPDARTVGGVPPRVLNER
jgi:hypothetical protein